MSSLQNKYKEDGKRSVYNSVYSQLPETAEIQFVKAVSELQSQVLHGGVGAPEHSVDLSSVLACV